MNRQLSLALFLVVMLPGISRATFPPTDLDSAIFYYNEEGFLPTNFSAGTQLNYSMFENGQFEQNTTELIGFTVPSDAIAPIPGFNSGDVVPLGGQTLTDLFPTDAPATINDLWAENNISAVGNFQDGFTEFSTHQRKVTNVSQDSGPFIDAQAIGKTYTPFDINAPGEQTLVNVDIHLDSVFNFSDNGLLSEGIMVQLVDVTNEEEPILLFEISGFYFSDQNGVSSSFLMGEQSLDENFSISQTSAEPNAPQEAVFAYEMNMMLDPSKTYGVAVSADASAGTDGLGSSYIDSSNTFDVAIRALETGATLTIPGFVIPEPTSLCLLAVMMTGLATSSRAQRS